MCLESESSCQIRLGLQYVEDFKQRIPRSEADQLIEAVRDAADKAYGQKQASGWFKNVMFIKLMWQHRFSVMMMGNKMTYLCIYSLMRIELELFHHFSRFWNYSSFVSCLLQVELIPCGSMRRGLAGMSRVILP